MLDDFALEPSENFNSIFLGIYFADSIGFKLVKLGPFSVWFQQIVHIF